MDYVVIHWDGNGSVSMTKEEAKRIAKKTGGKVRKLKADRSIAIDIRSGAGKDLRSVLRRAWHKSGARDLRLRFRFASKMQEWRTYKKQCHASPTSNKILILTPAPRFINTSKGDDAMISVTLGQVAAKWPEADVYLSTQSPAAEARVASYGVKSLPLEAGNEIKSGYEWIKHNRPTRVLVIGADVIDGAYDECFSLDLIALADLASRLGAVSEVLGFSFSKNPAKRLAAAFNETDEAVRFNLRDPVSFRRFKAFTSATARLTADIAFQLTANTAAESTLTKWIDDKKTSGFKVMGLNVHPSILPIAHRNQIPTLIAKVTDSISNLMRERKVCFVLIPHDFGGGAADRIVLDPLLHSLSQQFPERIRISEKELPGAEVKGFVKQLDGVVSARMHLAIASLGSGTPVLGINYKDKMEGLFEHFDLHDDSFIGAEDVLRGKGFYAKLVEFVDFLDLRREKVRGILPEVLELSASNFERLAYK